MYERLFGNNILVHLVVIIAQSIYRLIYTVIIYITYIVILYTRLTKHGYKH